MLADVTAAQTLAGRRAAELDRRHGTLRRRAAAAPLACHPVAPSRAGFAALLFQTLHVTRPAAAR